MKFSTISNIFTTLLSAASVIIAAPIANNSYYSTNFNTSQPFELFFSNTLKEFGNVEIETLEKSVKESQPRILDFKSSNDLEIASLASKNSLWNLLNEETLENPLTNNIYMQFIYEHANPQFVAALEKKIQETYTGYLKQFETFNSIKRKYPTEWHNVEKAFQQFYLEEDFHDDDTVSVQKWIIPHNYHIAGRTLVAGPRRAAKTGYVAGKLAALFVKSTYAFYNHVHGPQHDKEYDYAIQIAAAMVLGSVSGGAWGLESGILAGTIGGYRQGKTLGGECDPRMCGILTSIVGAGLGAFTGPTFGAAVGAYSGALHAAPKHNADDFFNVIFWRLLSRASKQVKQLKAKVSARRKNEKSLENELGVELSAPKAQFVSYEKLDRDDQKVLVAGDLVEGPIPGEGIFSAKKYVWESEKKDTFISAIGLVFPKLITPLSASNKSITGKINQTIWKLKYNHKNKVKNVFLTMRYSQSNSEDDHEEIPILTDIFFKKSIKPLKIELVLPQFKIPNDAKIIDISKASCIRRSIATNLEAKNNNKGSKNFENKFFKLKWIYDISISPNIVDIESNISFLSFSNGLNKEYETLGHSVLSNIQSL